MDSKRRLPVISRGADVQNRVERVVVETRVETMLTVGRHPEYFRLKHLPTTISQISYPPTFL